LSLPCKAHRRLLVEILRDSRYPDIGQSPMKEISVSTFPGDVNIMFNGYIASEKHTIYSGWLRLLTPNPKLGLKATAQRIHPLWINRSLPRRWKDCCDHCHGAECDKFRSGDFLFPNRPEWVIDVWRLCLVPGSTADEYMALSRMSECQIHARRNHALSTPNSSTVYLCVGNFSKRFQSFAGHTYTNPDPIMRRDD
jgi:hypothetical protein